MSGEKPLFDKERFDLGIKLVCDAFDEAGLTMVERFRASYILAASSASMMGFEVDELAAMLNLLTSEDR